RVPWAGLRVNGPGDGVRRWRSSVPILRPLGEHGHTAHLPEALATGETGTVYLCHPFLVHAVQPHRGTRPRFMAQPPLPRPLVLERRNGNYSAIETAVRRALGRPDPRPV
ncbi:MAG: hypothetical protein ACJ8AW_48160, partial [Rhodopila sp.]